MRGGLMLYTYDDAEKVRAGIGSARQRGQRYGKLGTRSLWVEERGPNGKPRKRYLTQLGGKVWQTEGEAREEMLKQPEPDKFAVYGVKADWARDTQPDPEAVDVIDPKACSHRYLTRWAEMVELDNGAVSA